MIRLATIGTSIITERFIEAVREVDGIEVTTTYSRTLARAEEFAVANGVPAASDDLDALYASGDIDAVYIGTPNGVHFAQARAAIAAGIQVFLEKPATTTSAEFEVLVAEANAAGVTVFEGMRNVYDPGFAMLRELLPQVGTVRLAAFAQCQYSARYDLVLAGETPNIFDPALAGGAAFDLGVYPLSALISLFGTPVDVSGSLVTIATGADGAGAALLTYPGMIAHVAFSKIGFSHRPNEIQGELGTLTVDETTQPRHLTLTLRDGTVTEHAVEGHDNNMVYEVARFVELMGGADPASDHQRTLDVLRVIERMRAAAA